MSHAKSDRRELLEIFHLAQRHHDARNYDVAHELLGECVVREPANLIVANAFVQNLAALEVPSPTRLRRWLDARPLTHQLDSPRMARTAIKRLTNDPTHQQALALLARRAESSEAPECAKCLLAYATARTSTVALRRQFAQLLVCLGEFGEALKQWRAILESQPDDDEACSRVEWLEPFAADDQSLDVVQAAGSVEEALEKADAFAEQQDWAEADAILRQALPLSPGDLRLHERIEDAEIAAQAGRAAAAAQQAEATARSEDQQIAGVLHQHQVALELDIIRRRAHRYPADEALQLRFARLLKQSNRWEEAIARLRPLAESSPTAEIWLDLGECYQWHRAFEDAQIAYGRAVTAAGESENPRVLKNALYRSGVLFQAAGDFSAAKSAFAQLVGLDGGFKDAAERLDKLESMRHKG